MSRVEEFEADQVVDQAVHEDDGDEAFLKLWVKAGSVAKVATLLGFMATCCGILYYHL